MLHVRRPEDLAGHLGTTIGPSGWRRIEQPTIDCFAEATGDHQWIHVDPERMRAQLGKATIAHGYLLLALIPGLASELVVVEEKTRVLNYGSDRVRYIAEVVSGSNVRLSQEIAEVILQDNGVRVVWNNTLELEGSPRPALAARTISLFQN
ncbi:MaoC family dehydratase [Chelatococcus asaccharovorans]|uniref:Acyl dehydratase n=1 Tax=Chelatococcus asaccharovorans TaxID=28210 RepID=A0A2V3TY40_9HYPH|nr:MaoC family dehydratase [Chelatococcus asaccharovorans]PXW53666.1 acyl dehydratase [Chelatococcus asaccharovorans]CAH1653287.1 3-hydroxyacyl-thioester dehydratase Z [Chelatococcus asaccharovorans]CAH1686089.1 3-hydroxyacyl-thioester dehydratase Z [Chelatococcus asaccharovorans]